MSRVLTLLMLLALPLAAPAQDSLDKLLDEVKKGQQQAAEANREREAQFLRNKNQQEELLQRAQRELAAVKRQTNAQKADFDKAAGEIAALKKQLEEQTGDLEQLFGVIRTSAGDARAIVRDSLTNPQIEQRSEFLADLADSRRPINLRKLEGLWFALQQEMTESGRVVTFDAPVVNAEGETNTQPVTRVGVFTATSNGEYLNYVPESGQLQVLPRQPGGGAQAMAREFEAAEADTARMIVDPTRGSLLALLVERPSLAERVRQGKEVGYVIIALGILGGILAIYQWLYLMGVGSKMRGQLKRIDQPKDNNPLGRILALVDAPETAGDDLETLELKLDEAVIRETPKLERMLGLLKLLAGVAPLLGLLGTVTGMIATFQSITLFGTGDPKLMAGGISQALVTTVLGLVVAIPLLFLHSLLSGRSRSLIRILDEQAAGLIARRVERRKGAASRVG
ncbi:MotA/TolQ/ExbB proton channel family protein [bacterium]|nr:MotA/TolQ/ExbB proton channel family protein [bacterium]